MTPDPGTVLWVASGVGGVAIIFGTWVWQSNGDKIKANAEAVKLLDAQKADDKELTRVRDQQVEIFKIIRNHEAEDRTRHEQLIRVMNDNQREIINLINERRIKPR